MEIRSDQQLHIDVRTTLDIGRARFASAFLAVLEHQGTDWMPTRFGPYEPLRHSYATEKASGFERCWMGGDDNDAEIGDVIFKMSRRVGGWGWVTWRRSWYATFNRLSLYLPVNEIGSYSGDSILALVEEMFKVFGGVYGSVMLDAEYRSQHTLPETGPNPHGIALEKHVPGVYFANFFGRELVELFGPTRLKECPAILTRPLDAGGWLLTTAGLPNQWDEPSALDLKHRVRMALGERYFFDIADPERATTAPAYDFSQVRIGERPSNMREPSVAEEFFSSDAAARGFIEERELWCNRLRERLPQNGLNLSRSSLRILDNHLAGIAAGDSGGAAHALVLEVAAYYGEVVRETLGAAWEVDCNDARMPALRLASGDVEYPLVRSIKLLEDGDRLSDWFEFIARGGQGLLH